jgi:AbrB family looped-hinge helix DNA binding protein
VYDFVVFGGALGNFLFTRLRKLRIIRYNEYNEFILSGGDLMNLAKVSVNGQVTVPIEVRKALRLKTGDKLLFLNKSNGEVVITNASVNAIKNAQKVFSDAAESAGFKNDDDVVDEIMRMRYGTSNE